jgi:histidinol-phosphatase (PHP family)
MEINTKSLYSLKELDPYPSHWILKKAKEYNISIILSSDAHKPEFLISGFQEVESLLEIMDYINFAKF